MTETLVKTQSCYVAILDEASPVNTLDFMTTSFEAGKAEARARGLEEFHGLFVFNDQLIHAAETGQLLAWTLLFDGVFRAVVHLTPSSLPTEIAKSTNLGSPTLTGELHCPTGRLLICCLSDFGKQQRPFVLVEPGTYRVSVRRDDDAELRHSLLESPDYYPFGDRPDWTVQVERVKTSRDDT